MFRRMKKEEGNVRDQDSGVTHCLEASEDTLEHCLYMAIQSFLWGENVSKPACFLWGIVVLPTILGQKGK